MTSKMKGVWDYKELEAVTSEPETKSPREEPPRTADNRQLPPDYSDDPPPKAGTLLCCLVHDDDDQSGRGDRPSSSCPVRYWHFSCGTPKRQCLCLLATLLFLIVVFFPIVYLVAVPGLAAQYIQGATIGLVRGHLSHISATQAHLNATLAIDNAGPFDASLGSFVAKIGYEGREFASFHFPSIEIKGNAPNTVEISSPLIVHDAALMARSLRPSFKGGVSLWHVGGSVHVTICGGLLRANVDLDNEMPLPSLQLQQVLAKNLQLRAGDGPSGSITADIDISFVSTSVLEVTGIGDISLDYFSLNNAANQTDAPPAKLKVGSVSIPAFEIRRGLNQFASRFNGMLISPDQANSNYEAMADVFGVYASRKQNIGLVKGPTANSKHADYLLDVLSQTFAMEGAPHEMFPSAALSLETVQDGYNPKTGEICSVLSDGGDFPSCSRGAMIVGRPVFEKRMAYGGLIMDVTMEQAIPAYNITYSFFGLLGATSCRQTDVLTRIVSLPGANYKGKFTDDGEIAGSRVHEWSVGGLTRNTTALDASEFTFYGGSINSEQAYAAVRPSDFYGAVYPKKATDSSPKDAVYNGLDYSCFDSLLALDCCSLSRYTALACLGRNAAPTTARGNVTIYIDTWSINVTSTHKLLLSVPKAIESLAITDRKTAQFVAGFNCSAFNFTK